MKSLLALAIAFSLSHTALAGNTNVTLNETASNELYNVLNEKTLILGDFSIFCQNQGTPSCNIFGTLGQGQNLFVAGMDVNARALYNALDVPFVLQGSLPSQYKSKTFESSDGVVKIHCTSGFHREVCTVNPWSN